jgi:hypothetical protein
MEIIRLDSAIRVRGSDKKAGSERQLALALATSMVPRLRRWAEAKSRLDAEIWGLESKLEEWRSPLVAGTRGSPEAARIEEERATLEEQLLRVRSELRNIERRPWRHLRALWLLVWGDAWRAEREAARRRLDQHESRLDELSSRLSEEVEGLSEVLESLRQRRRDLEPIPRVVEGVRGLDYVFVPRRVRRNKGERGRQRNAGGWILADPFGDPMAVDAPKVALSAQELEELRDSLAGLDLSAVLLEPDEAEAGSGSAGPSVGAERELVDVTAGLSKFVRTTEARSLSLPVLPPEKPLARYLVDLLREFEDPGRASVTPELDRESRTRLSEVRRTADGLGAVVRSNLHAPPELYSAFAARAAGLPELVRHAGAERARSASALAHGVRRSRMNAELVRYHRFCPECNTFPSYMAKAYGLTEDAVDQLDTPRLKRALAELRDRRLDTIEGRRLGPGSPERIALDERWQHTFEELDGLAEVCRFHQAELQALERTEASTTPEGRLRREMAKREIRMRKARYRELVHHLETQPLALPETAAAAPDDADDGVRVSSAHQALDPRSRLVYDPSDDEAPWSCGRCGTTFDGDTALLGAVDRLRTDVVYPMLAGLWEHRSVRAGADKAIERAAEEIADRSEEEAGVLQEPIDSFRSDAQRLRIHAEEAHARGLIVSGRLLKVAEQYGQFGLLQREELERVRRTAQGTVDRMNDIRRALDRLAAAERGMEDTIRAGRRARAAPTPPDRRFLERDAARLTPFAEGARAEVDLAAGQARPAHGAAGTELGDAVPLENDGNPCTVCGSPAPALSIFCPSCGADLPPRVAAPRSARERAGDAPATPYSPGEGSRKPHRTSMGVPRDD